MSQETKRYGFIVTKYLGPTNYRGSRIKATINIGGEDHSVVVSRESADGIYDAHLHAAQAVLEKLSRTSAGRGGNWRVRDDIFGHGELPESMGRKNGYVFVCEWPMVHKGDYTL